MREATGDLWTYPADAVVVPSQIFDAYKRVASEARAFSDHPTIRAEFSVDVGTERSAYGLLLDSINTLDETLKSTSLPDTKNAKMEAE